MERKWMVVGFWALTTWTTHGGSWGGINAGLILLQPDYYVFQQMLSEVTCKNHTCHVAGSGPEQDLLVSFLCCPGGISLGIISALHGSTSCINLCLPPSGFRNGESFLETKGTGLFRGKL